MAKALLPHLSFSQTRGMPYHLIVPLPKGITNQDKYVYLGVLQGLIGKEFTRLRRNGEIPAVTPEIFNGKKGFDDAAIQTKLNQLNTLEARTLQRRLVGILHGNETYGELHRKYVLDREIDLAQHEKESTNIVPFKITVFGTKAGTVRLGTAFPPGCTPRHIGLITYGFTKAVADTLRQHGYKLPQSVDNLVEKKVVRLKRRPGVIRGISISLPEKLQTLPIALSQLKRRPPKGLTDKYRQKREEWTEIASTAYGVVHEADYRFKSTLPIERLKMEIQGG
ncbi:MAG: hypothetical protein V1708_06495 [Candidatus Micrarchaeota archaeon]